MATTVKEHRSMETWIMRVEFRKPIICEQLCVQIDMKKESLNTCSVSLCSVQVYPLLDYIRFLSAFLSSTCLFSLPVMVLTWSSYNTRFSPFSKFVCVSENLEWACKSAYVQVCSSTTCMEKGTGEVYCTSNTKLVFLALRTASFTVCAYH